MLHVLLVPDLVFASLLWSTRNTRQSFCNGRNKLSSLAPSSLLPLLFFVIIIGHDVHYTPNVPPKLGTNKELHCLHGQISERSRLRSRSNLHNLMLAPCVCVIWILHRSSLVPVREGHKQPPNSTLVENDQHLFLRITRSAPKTVEVASLIRKKNYFCLIS